MYTLPALELDSRLFPPSSCLAIHIVNMASKMPSGITIPALSKKLLQLEREVEILNTLFMFLTQQYEEAKIQEA